MLTSSYTGSQTARPGPVSFNVKISKTYTCQSLNNGIVFILMYSFEFDPKKSESNQEKHGIDFVDVQAIWQDPDLIEVQAKSDDETRSLVVGMINGKYWSAIITYRSEIIRIIYVRRSRESEVALYES